MPESPSQPPNNKGDKWPELITRLLCRLGFHDFRVIEETFGFGMGGDVKKVECKRCGIITTRRA